MNEIEKIKQILIKLLARREHSQYELRQKLKRYNLNVNDIELVLKELADKNLQSDERFAEAYVVSRMNKGFGPIHIKQELSERKIEDNIIKKYVNKYDEIWNELINKVYKKRFKTKPTNFKEQMKQKSFLQYRGFTQEQINSIFI